MIHYIANIVSPSELVSRRKPVSFESGYKRALFISKAIDDYVSIVSMGAGEKKGFFKKLVVPHSEKIKIVYLPQWHFTIFKKKARHFFYSFFLFGYLIRNIKKTDKLILYNSSKSFFMIIPVLVFKIFRKVNYILEIEELYSYKEDSRNLGFAERISINNAAACLLVSNPILKFINPGKPVLLNAGYYFPEEKIEFSKSNEFQIVYSGRLDKEGGVFVLLDAIQYINFKCKIVITGKGEYEKEVKNYKNNNPFVHYNYLGVLNEDEYKTMLCNSTIAINPILQFNDFASISFPSKVTQYLAYGLSVVSSNVQSLKILGELNDYIYTYEADDPKTLSEKINTIYTIVLNEKVTVIEKTKIFFKKSETDLKNFISNVN